MPGVVLLLNFVPNAPDYFILTMLDVLIAARLFSVAHPAEWLIALQLTTAGDAVNPWWLGRVVAVEIYKAAVH